MSWTIREVDPASGDAVLLMRALDVELQARYPGAVIQGIDSQVLRESGGVFLVGYDGTNPVACGAIRPLADGSFEVKRMFVVGTARRRGYAHALLAALEVQADRLGAELVRLETGDGQPEAMAMYEAAGYRIAPCYGEYSGSPHSRCFEKRLRTIDRVP